MKTSEFEYDTPGRMVEHTDFFGDVFHYGYDFAGRLAMTAYPNGVITRYSYKNEGRLHQITHARRTSTHQGGVTEETLESFTYDYDGNGNITKITEADGCYTDYAYDEWNRLTDEHRRTEESGTIYRNQFAYDDVGNILARTSTIGEQAPQTTEYEYDGYNKLTGITRPDATTEALSYDGNGQLTNRTKSTGEATEYQWNTRGFLEKVILPTGEQVEYQYDGANRLIGRKSSEGKDSFVQAGWSIVSEADELKRKTYYTGLSSKNSQDEFKYFHYNHRGDTVLVTDKNGEVVGKFDYEAYGNVIGSDGLNVDEVALKNLPNVFVGAYGIRYDTKTDLSYMRFRWYSPETMRFVSPDRLMGVNRYGYVNGNPMKYYDYYGAQESLTSIPVSSLGQYSVTPEGQVIVFDPESPVYSVPPILTTGTITDLGYTPIDFDILNPWDPETEFWVYENFGPGWGNAMIFFTTVAEVDLFLLPYVMRYECKTSSTTYFAKIKKENLIVILNKSKKNIGRKQRFRWGWRIDRGHQDHQWPFNIPHPQFWGPEKPIWGPGRPPWWIEWLIGWPSKR
jgi:RHS repeat-associated protein